jgi:hypothetical protein
MKIERGVKAFLAIGQLTFLGTIMNGDSEMRFREGL